MVPFSASEVDNDAGSGRAFGYFEEAGTGSEDLLVTLTGGADSIKDTFLTDDLVHFELHAELS